MRPKIYGTLTAAGEFDPGAGMPSRSLAALRAKAGGARRDRTDDLLNANQALFQLSYGPEICR